MIGQTLGSYRLVSTIGQGGMGVVYRAEHVLIGKQAAVKVLLPEMTRDAHLVERFFNEARAAALIKHPGLVEVFDFGHHDDGNAFIVMELLEGEALSARMQREAKLPIDIALSIARQVASALHAAHEQGIVHRDLKPENIFLVTDPDAPGGIRTKVLDFGIAKLARVDEHRSVKTKTGAVFGTPRYMAPEQCKNATNVDRRADIYALGCILYEMLLGRAPFDYDNWGELVAAHIHETPPAPRELDPTLPRAVEAILLRALAKKLDDRYPTMQELARDLESAWRARAGQGHAAHFTPPAGVATRSPRPVSNPDTSANTLPQVARGVAQTLPVTGELARPPRPAKARPWLAVGGGVVLAAGVAGYFAFARSPHEPAERRAVQPPASTADAAIVSALAHDAAAVVSDVASPAVDHIRLRIESTPSGADVYRAADGIKLGKTPLEREYDRTEGEAELIVRLAGYRDARVALPTTKDGDAAVTLVRAKAAHVAKHAATGKGSDTARGSGGTTVLDPYGDGK